MGHGHVVLGWGRGEGRGVTDKVDTKGIHVQIAGFAWFRGLVPTPSPYRMAWE